MAVSRTCADLGNNYNEISKICHETKEPVYITKNGYNDVVILSNEAYEKFEEERIDRLIDEHFNGKYPDLESFKKDVKKKIDKALKDVEEGRCQPMEEVLAEMEAKYGFSKL